MGLPLKTTWKLWLIQNAVAQAVIETCLYPTFSEGMYFKSLQSIVQLKKHAFSVMPPPFWDSIFLMQDCPL